MDNAEVPETGCVLVVTPAIYATMKKCKDFVMETDVGNELRLQGVIAMLDGMNVQKIPANRLPKNFGFMIAHPCATVAPLSWRTTPSTRTRLAFPALWWKAASAMTLSSWTTRQRLSIIRQFPHSTGGDYVGFNANDYP